MNDRTDPGRSVLAMASALAAAFASTAAPANASDGVTRSRALARFDRIALDGAFTATIVAAASPSFTMTGRPDDLERVTVTVTDGCLTVGMRPGTIHAGTIALSIATQKLRSFENQGAGRIRLSGLRDDVEIENRGIATVDASGRASRLTVVNDGIGKIDAAALDARDATVTNNGVGSISVRTSRSLVMNVNGIGQIRYAGTPARVERNVNGLGRIGRL